MALVGVEVYVCVLCKAVLMKKSLLTIAEECVCMCETGADVTCRVTHPDTTAVCQTGVRAGRGLCVCAL